MPPNYNDRSLDAYLAVREQVALVQKCDPRSDEETPEGISLEGVEETTWERFEAEKRLLKFLYDQALTEGVPAKKLDALMEAVPA